MGSLTKNGIKAPYFTIAGAVVVAAVLVCLGLHNYLLFHTIVEFFSILISLGIAAIAMHTSRIAYKNDHC